MQNKTSELLVGLFILASIIALLTLALQVSGLGQIAGSNGYSIIAKFENIGDLRVRAPVSIAGVRIGEVTKIVLDKTTFKAIVTMQINPQQNAIPTDSSASILTEGLLGSNYISLSPGFADTNLKEGDNINDTHPAIILENLIGQLMFKLGKSK